MSSIAFMILLLYVLVAAVGLWLEYLNCRHLKECGVAVPVGFEAAVDTGRLRKIQEYTLEKSRFGMFSSVFDDLVAIVFIFCGVLAWYDGWIRSINVPFIAAAMIFFLVLSVAAVLLNLPFAAYQTFKIEAKHGFNTMGVKTWLGDLVKSLLISGVLTGVLVAGSFWLIAASPRFWWLWVWLFVAVFSIVMMYLAPYVIEPLFNKYEPIKDEQLAVKLKELFSTIGIRVEKVQTMDASKRTRHSNAYFTGIGKVKRIVIYDTLHNSMSEDELLAILAHEAGHWKRKHIMKMLCLFEIASLVGIYIAFRLVDGDLLGWIFGVGQASLMTKLVLLQFVAGIVMTPLAPLANMLSRRFEREADDFAVALLGGSEGLANALVKLSTENLSNLHPHPFYAFWHYSHPPVQERVRRLLASKAEPLII